MTEGRPAYCNGCPRRGPFLAMARMGLVVRGDVVCHVNGAVPPAAVLQTCRDLPEGVSVTPPRSGAAGPGSGGGRPGGHKRGEFRGREIRVISDRDFLDSDLAAMIDVPSSGDGLVTVVFANGNAEAEEGVADRCHALGLDQVAVVDPYSVDAVGAALRESLAATATSVVIAEAPCALLHDLQNPVYVVDPDLCIGCKHCLKVGCDALVLVEDAEGVRKVEIVAAECVGCGLCPQLCREDAISQS